MKLIARGEDGGPGRSRAWSKRLTLLVVVLVSGVSIAGYVALSATVNGLPPYGLFPGWVTLLQPARAPLGDQVKLQVLSYAVGEHPLVAYTVAACGPSPYSADLVIGGKAQLTGVRLYPPQLATEYPSLRVQHLADLQLGYDQVYDFGDVEVIPFTLPQVNCVTVPGQSPPAGSLLYGAAWGVSGFAAAPFEQSWRGPWGWWRGPHVTQAWPLTGSLQGVTVHGEFNGLAGLSRQWLRPDADITITQVGFPLNQSLDAAVPIPSDPSVPGWSGTDFISPIVRLTDTGSMAQLQDWIVVSAVGLGVGGGMLASLLFEWLRPRPAHTGAREPTRPPHATPPGPPSRPETAPRWSKPTAALIGTGLVMIWIRNRRNRRSM